ncbi:unnamed protein product [Nezara viridula]|uniref:Uncharacterized protein n=1 Tax=Nezara viridula TaxID=85310 RepID=A0A9P0EBZ0_NEZVI|nr:unnamed protein product [Nezara viridula]
MLTVLPINARLACSYKRPDERVSYYSVEIPTPLTNTITSSAEERRSMIAHEAHDIARGPVIRQQVPTPITPLSLPIT